MYVMVIEFKFNFLLVKISEIKLDNFYHWTIGLMSRVLASGQGDQGSILGWVIPKTQKIVLDANLLNAQHYKVGVKDKVKQSREWSSAPLYLGVGSIEKRPFGSPSTKVDLTLPQYSIYYLLYCYIHNTSAYTSFGLLQVFQVELGSQHRT